MSLQIEIAFSVPKETARVAHASFPKGNVYLTMRDQLGTLFEDEQFVDLFPPKGQPAEAPWRLALVTVMQFAENLPDRQAADAVRSRIDWKYAMGLELIDPGFDFSILCEFRGRLLANGAEQRLFDTLLRLCRERGWLKARGQQRTDSTHVLAAIHALNRLENVGETLRHTLDVLAQAAPDWLRTILQPEWVDRYGKRFENYRLPRDKAQRAQLAATVGADGLVLLKAVYDPQAPSDLRQLPAVCALRQVWVQQFVIEEGKLRWRHSNELPPASILINSPYDVEARYSIKRETVWTGYKAHLTETCDEDTPHLITHVQTTAGTTQDCDVTADIHADLAQANLLPRTHLADAGYLDAPLLVDSTKEYDIELVGPVARDGSWQAVAAQGFDQSHFSVDWQAQQVTCPRGKHSHVWMPQKDGFDNDVIHVKFSAADCQACEVRSLCTHSRSGRRELALRPKEQYLALQSARAHQKTLHFKERYNVRAGIEGTLSQGIEVGGMRRSRYIGLAKTHLQNVVIATALNVLRLVAWLWDVPRAKTRTSHFACFCAQIAPAAGAI
jgi:transposase